MELGHDGVANGTDQTSFVCAVAIEKLVCQKEAHKVHLFTHCSLKFSGSTLHAKGKKESTTSCSSMTVD